MMRCVRNTESFTGTVYTTWQITLQLDLQGCVWAFTGSWTQHCWHQTAAPSVTVLFGWKNQLSGEKKCFLHNYKPSSPDSMNKSIFVYRTVCTIDESWWWQLKMIKTNWWRKTALRLFWLFWTGFSCHLFAFAHVMQISAVKQMSLKLTRITAKAVRGLSQTR